MSIIEKSSLFELIKSLNKSEKGYFKKYCSLHGESNKKYLLLFDTINEMAVYSEKKIESVFKKESLSSELSVIKTYLYKLLLRSLESYHTTIVFDLRSSVTQCEILFQKGLFSQCQRMINKIKKNASQYDQFLYLYEALKIERQVIHQTQSGDFIAAGRINSEIDKVFSIINNIEVYSKLITEESSILGTGINTMGQELSARKKKKYEKLISSKELKNENQALSITGKLLYHRLHSAYFQVKGDYKRALEYVKRRVYLLEANKHFIEKNPLDYIVSVGHLIRIYAGLKMYDDALMNIEKMKAMEETYSVKLSRLKQKELFYMAYMSETAICLESGQFENINDIVPEIEAGLEKFGELFDLLDKSVIYYHVAVLYLGNKQFREALEWINKALNTLSFSPANSTFYFACRCVQFIIHFELGNSDILPYLLKSLYRVYYKNPATLEEGLLVLSFAKILKEVDITSRKGTMALLVEVKNLLQENIKKNKYKDKEILQLIIYWLTGKIENKSLPEIIRRELKNSK